MSPFLEAGTTPNEGKVVKFVTLKDKIYYSDAKGDSIALESHSKLARRAGADTFDADHRPMVDDGGNLVFLDGKVKFSGSTESCTVNSPETARKITAEVAKKILGEDRVY
jgi:hypothetical protein